MDGDLAELKESRDAGACAVEHAVGVFLRLEQPRWQGLRAVPTQVHRTPELVLAAPQAPDVIAR